MNDFEMMSSILGHANADFEIDEREFPPYGNGKRRSIKLTVDNFGHLTGKITNISGYNGFMCHFVFDDDGNLEDIFIWE